MGRTGPRPFLDAMKKREIVAIVSVGCSRRLAAAYVGGHPSTIYETALRDPEFADRLRQAECRLEIDNLRSIQEAGKKAQYWRAAAWVLERKNPADFAPRAPDVVTAEQLQQAMVRFGQILAAELPNPEQQKQVMDRVMALVQSLLPSAAPSKPDDNA